MKKEIEIIVANPAGNVTIFVRQPFRKNEYSKVAKQLLSMEELNGEQVAYILSDAECKPEPKENPTAAHAQTYAMEMCGLEFCGNATRSFALLVARQLGVSGETSVNVKVSGSDEVLPVTVDTTSGFTKVRMPNPHRIIPFSPIENVNGTLVDFGGIMHFVLDGADADAEFFEKIKEKIYQEFDPPAFGVMFCHGGKGVECKTKLMEPVVYVKNVDTTYFEGSCASGTTACGAALVKGEKDGIYTFTFKQPAGTLSSTIVVEKGALTEIFIEGLVEIGPTKKVLVDI